MNSIEQGSPASTDAVEQVRAELCSIADATRKKLLGFCISKGLSFEDSEDVVQSVFCTAYGTAKNFRREGSLEGWLLGILKFSIIDEIRKTVRERSVYSDTNPDMVGHPSKEYRDFEHRHDVAKLLLRVSAPRQLHAVAVLMRDGEIENNHAMGCSVCSAVRTMRAALTRRTRAAR